MHVTDNQGKIAEVEVNDLADPELSAEGHMSGTNGLSRVAYEPRWKLAFALLVLGLLAALATAPASAQQISGACDSSRERASRERAVVLPPDCIPSEIVVRDSATIDVPKGGLFSSGEPTREIKEKARAEAKMKAWARFKAQNTSGARASLFAEHDKSLLDRLDSGLCTFTFYDEQFDKTDATFHVKVRGFCDPKAIEAALESLVQASQSGSGASVGRSVADKASFTFVFFARRAADSKEFVDKVLSERSVTVATTGAEASVESSQSTKTSNEQKSADAVAVTQLARTETKGTIQKRDTQYDYVVEQSNAVNNAVSNVLVTAGFEVAGYSDLLEQCPGVPLNDIVPFFAKPEANQAELIPPAMRTRMYNSARQCEQHFFAVGLLDILKAERRAEDGMEFVTVALTIDVRDIRKRIPTQVAVIPVKQSRQKGNNRLEAANNALVAAAEQGTREIVDMLRKRGIQ